MSTNVQTFAIIYRIIANIGEIPTLYYYEAVICGTLKLASLGSFGGPP
jgi:hypothetical protein